MTASTQAGNIERDAVRRAIWDSGATDREAAELLGITSAAYRGWRRRHGLLRPPAETKTARAALGTLSPTQKARDAERRAMHASGMPDVSIAEAQGVAQSTVRNWRQRRRLPPNWARSIDEQTVPYCRTRCRRVVRALRGGACWRGACAAEDLTTDEARAMFARAGRDLPPEATT